MEKVIWKYSEEREKLVAKYSAIYNRFPGKLTLELSHIFIRYLEQLPPILDFLKKEWDGVPHINQDGLTKLAMQFQQSLLKRSSFINLWSGLRYLGWDICDGRTFIQTDYGILEGANKVYTYGFVKSKDPNKPPTKVGGRIFFESTTSEIENVYKDTWMKEPRPTDKFSRLQQTPGYPPNLKIKMTPEFIKSIQRLEEQGKVMKAALERFNDPKKDAGDKYIQMVKLIAEQLDGKSTDSL